MIQFLLPAYVALRGVKIRGTFEHLRKLETVLENILGC
jgi:hypothetical protein